MNEFIVWDKSAKNWCEGTLLKMDGTVASSHPEHYEVCKWIGKKDINDKEIYADCSIVEFLWRNEKTRAFISWDDIQLTYDVVFVKNGLRLAYHEIYQEMIGIKIIGTLQEKPELLEQK